MSSNIHFVPIRRCRVKGASGIMAEDGTPMRVQGGQLYPRPLEYVNKCVMIVEWWLHRHGGDIDSLMDKLAERKP